eukprot:332977_1
MAKCTAKLACKQDNLGRAIERSGIIKRAIAKEKDMIKYQAQEQITIIEQEKRIRLAQVDKKYHVELQQKRNHEAQVRASVERYKDYLTQCTTYVKVLESNRRILKASVYGKKTTGTLQPLPPIPNLERKRSDRKNKKKKGKPNLEKK